MAASSTHYDPVIPVPRAPLPVAVEQFLISMPASYHSVFSEADARDHASIVWQRNRAIAHVEQWTPPGSGAIWLCVVTDDRPGLLALLSAAITAHSLNIVDAKIYCHMGYEGQNEAVDFFRVVPLKPGGLAALTNLGLIALRNTIDDVLEGKIDLQTLRKRSLPTSRPRARPETSVYFDGRVNSADRLIVETDDQPGLLAHITTALFKVNVSIVWSNVATLAGRAQDEFHLLGPNGEQLTALRKDGVVEQLLAALDLLSPHQPDKGEPLEADTAVQADLDEARPSQMFEPVPAPGPRPFTKPPTAR